MRTNKRKRNSNYVVVKKGNVFIAESSDLGLFGRAATGQEAIANLEGALALHFEGLPGSADG